MDVLRNGQGWELGGPMVLHSPWWISVHWGRAFEVVNLKPDGFAADPGAGHGAVLMRKRPVDVTPADLEAIEPGEPREATALAHNVRQVLAEVADLRRAHEIQRRELEDVQRRLQIMAGSRSWALTRPLRRLTSGVRSRRP